VGETFEGRKHGHRRSAALWSAENRCNSAQQAKFDELIRHDKDNGENAEQLGVGHREVQDDGDFGTSESLFPLGSLFAYGYRGTQNGWELLSHPPYSPDLTLSDYHLFRPLKDHLRGHNYETDEAVQETVRS
jgi:hypothetical protein